MLYLLGLCTKESLSGINIFGGGFASLYHQPKIHSRKYVRLLVLILEFVLCYHSSIDIIVVFSVLYSQLITEFPSISHFTHILQVCSYPFTTRGILMGHIVSNHERFQVQAFVFLPTLLCTLSHQISHQFCSSFFLTLNKGILLQVTDTPGLLTRHDGELRLVLKLVTSEVVYLSCVNVWHSFCVQRIFSPLYLDNKQTILQQIWFLMQLTFDQHLLRIQAISL